jgi:hypothetical protein
MIDVFEHFMKDKEAWDMYVTGVAGTGKTTSLRTGVEYCISHEIPYVVCAYTHKACGILQSKLPEGANVITLHSFLGKRPYVNTHATADRYVNQSIKTAKTKSEPKVMFLDEYSMVGEKDYADIQGAQDSDYDAIPELKVVWIGDYHQLPPVGDTIAIKAHGKYQVSLTKQWRNDNPLQGPLGKLVSYIDGTQPTALCAVPGFFERGKDLIAEYKACEEDKVMLAYTNKCVEVLNAEAAGRVKPRAKDKVFSPTTNKYYKFLGWDTHPSHIDLHYSDPLHLGSKFKTLENLIDSKLCRFALLEDEDGLPHTHAVVFGHYEYKLTREALESSAVKANKAIELKHKGYRAAGWAKANARAKLSRTRSKAWRDCLSFKDCVICLDFTHAMTVHKSQGSTFHTVFVDTGDLGACADRDFTLYLKLMYVAISRASHKVITS